tara:strand:- start:45 stop:629 length:585 start_codon:yes stop_codon:yes gene_type:complete
MKNFLVASVFFWLLKTRYSFGSEGGMPQLNTEFWIPQIFWLILVFGLLNLFIWKWILPKITSGIENRKSHIINDLNDAQNYKEEAEKKLVKYKETIEKAKKDAREIISEGRKKLEVEITAKRKKFEKDIEDELTTAENQIKKFKESSIQNINKIAIEISKDIVKKIIGSDVNSSNVSAIVEDTSKKKIRNIYEY